MLGIMPDMIFQTIINFMQNKKPLNDKGLAYGLWEEYYSNGNLMYKGSYLKGKQIGLCECYYSNGNLMYKGSFIKGKQIGLWIHGNNDGLIKQISFYAR